MMSALRNPSSATKPLRSQAFITSGTYTGEGENTCELVILRDEAEVAAAQRMYEDTNGDMGEVVVAPVREVPTLAGLIT